MKKQTGMRVDSQVWEDYRKLCSSEKLRPAEAAEEFLKLVLRTGSPRTVLTIMKDMEKSRVEGLEAYTRLLLDWYTHEKFWFYTGDEEQQPTEQLLLEALKNVQDQKLRRQIEEALVARGRRQQEELKRVLEEERREEEEEKRENRELQEEEEPKEPVEADNKEEDSVDIETVKQKIEKMKGELAARRKR